MFLKKPIQPIRKAYERYSCTTVCWGLGIQYIYFQWILKLQYLVYIKLEFQALIKDP